MARPIIALALIPLLLAGCQDAVVSPRWLGKIEPRNADRALEKIGDNLDHIVGVQASIAPASEGDFEAFHYMSDDKDEDGRLIISTMSYEMLFPKGSYRWEHGAFVVDGFFLVKSGGVHQGVLSLSMEPVAEAAVRTNSALKVIDRKL